MRQVVFACLTLVLATPALADGNQKVMDRASFVSLVEGRTLSLMGIKLNVGSDGRITGRAFGRPVTGEWTWKSRYFCRSMQWGDEPIPHNCQTVDRIGGKLRFRSDRGTGDYADLRID